LAGRERAEGRRAEGERGGSGRGREIRKKRQGDKEEARLGEQDFLFPCVERRGRGREPEARRAAGFRKKNQREDKPSAVTKKSLAIEIFSFFFRNL
jgi:hypothetical protein